MAYILGMDRNQAQIFPEYLDNYIDNDNPVRIIEVFVESLDLKKLKFTKTNSGDPSAPSYTPKDLFIGIFQLVRTALTKISAQSRQRDE